MHPFAIKRLPWHNRSIEGDAQARENIANALVFNYWILAG